MINFDSSGSVKGIGVDCTRISRFAKLEVNVLEKLARKILTEQEYFDYSSCNNKPKKLACFFCCKEAVSKALGTGFSCFGFSDIMILKDDNNRPYVSLNRKAANVAGEKGISAIKVSITHEGDYVICFAVSE